MKPTLQYCLNFGFGLFRQLSYSVTSMSAIEMKRDNVELYNV